MLAVPIHMSKPGESLPMQKPLSIVLAAGLAACASAQSTTESAALRIVDAPVVNLPAEAESAVPVTVDASAFAAGTALMPLGTGETLRISIDRTRQHSDISTSWSGTVEGVEHGWFSFVQYDDAFHGIIGAGELGKFELRTSGQSTADGQHVYNLVKIDESKYPGCAIDDLPPAANRGIRPVDISATPTPNTNLGTHSHAGDTGEPLYNVDDGSVIDVMIVYTAEARNGWGGTNNIMALAQNCIDTSNIAYTNSNIGPRWGRICSAEMGRLTVMFRFFLQGWCHAQFHKHADWRIPKDQSIPRFHGPHFSNAECCFCTRIRAG